jgi:hypothetical protein
MPISMRPSTVVPSVPTSALKLARRGPSDYGVISRTETLDCHMHASNHLVFPHYLKSARCLFVFCLLSGIVFDVRDLGLGDVN